MCLAIYKPKGAIVKKRWLENGFDANSDGAGFAWANEESTVIERGFFDFQAFWKAYRPHQEKSCLIHFRLATSGARNEQNCHPFPLCGGKYAVIHNGILNIQSSNELSDTGHFVSLVLEPLVSKIGLEDPALSYLVEQAIGSCNKIAVMKPDGSAVVFNEKQGMWVNGAWYSNNSYMERPKTPIWMGTDSNARDPLFWERNRDDRRMFDSENEESDLVEYYQSMGFGWKDAQRAAKRDIGLQLDPF